MIRRSMVLVVSFLAFVPPTRSAVTAGQDPKAAPAAQAATASPVVVKLLGESITEKQVLDTINQMARVPGVTQQQQQQKNIAFYKEALDTLIGGILLKNEAKEKKIIPDQAKVNESFQSLKKQFPNEEAFQKALQQQGMKETDVRTSIENNLIYQLVLDGIIKSIPSPTDAEMQKFYDENPNYFAEPEQVHASHVFLKVDKTATPEQKAEIRKKIEGIRADLEAKTITFAEAAAKYSDDKSNAQTGGDLGFFARGQMLMPLEQAAFGAQPGTLSPIVETEYGFHVINVIEVKPAGKTPLEKAKPDIKTYLERKAKEDATKKHIEELKAKAKIEVVMSDEEWNKRNAAK